MVFGAKVVLVKRWFLVSSIHFRPRGQVRVGCLSYVAVIVIVVIVDAGPPGPRCVTVPQ